MHVYVSVYACMLYVRMYVCMYVCMHARIHACMYTCVYIPVETYMNSCTERYTYITGRSSLTEGRAHAGVLA